MIAAAAQHRPVSRVVRGVVAMLLLAVLSAGVPYALVRCVGRPWPHPFPSLETVWRSLRRGDISDAAVVKILAVLVWLTWARLAVSLVIEVVARLAGRSVPRFAALGSSQQWAGALVAAAVLLMASSPRGAGASAAVPAHLPLPAALLVIDAEPLMFEPGSATAPPTASPDPVTVIEGTVAPNPEPHPVGVTYTVQRNDSFWSIAEAALGDGSRWHEIVELNRGSEVAPGVVFDGTAHRLLPGWQLLIAGTTTTPPPVAPPSTTVGRTVRVVAGDTLSGIARRELGRATDWPRLWEANRGHDFGGRIFDDPNLILTGWELVVPGDEVRPSVAELAPATAPAPVPVPAPIPAPVPAPVPVLAAEPTAADVPVTEVPAVEIPIVEPAADVVRPAPQRTEQILDRPSGLGAAVLLASGITVGVAVRRRRRLRSASVNARLPQPTRNLVAVETVLRAIDDGERIARIDIALRALATELSQMNCAAGVVAVLATDDGAIEVILTGPVVLVPAPWVAVADGRYRLPAAVALADIAEQARRANQPCPALAHLGSCRVGDGGGAGAQAQLFVDLEAMGLLAISATRPDATNVARAIAAGVAVSPLAETAHLITCGFSETHLGRFCTDDADSLDAALDRAVQAIGTTAATTSTGLSTFTLRARHHGGEAWEPAIVVVTEPRHGAPATGDDPAEPPHPTGALADADLVALTSTGGRGLAVVIDRAVAGARWVIEQRRLTWVLEPLGLEFSPVGLTALDVGRVAALLDEAAQPLDLVTPGPGPAPDAVVPDAVVPDGAVPDVDAPRDLEHDSRSTQPWCLPPWSILVRLLGPVEVTDGAGRIAEFERSKALELVVWLSQHRDRSTRTAARTALWELNVRDATFANVVSDSRRTLARLAPVGNGEEWIGRTLTEQLPLHPGVITDADLLRLRFEHARTLSPQGVIDVLRPGLELVRDLVFFGTSYLWPDTEGITSQLTLLVTSSATLLGEQYLRLGDIDGVFWATGQGLKVLAGHEELIALRMRAHARQGDLAGVRQEWESYERALNADVWSSGDPAPKLVALRRELLSLSLQQV
ncbi:unannotated protein [freshwater metagenome]|uniref:Unannotated protein n=1 Tax=freshwater metagenome TaxID=449393 RepID=A0A6J7EPD8_9ZZZZ